MGPLGVWWAVAGGWAIDRWIGEQTREHHDVEVVVRRADRGTVWDGLHADFTLGRIDPPGSGWQHWHREDAMDFPSFQLQAGRADLVFDIFLETVVDATWRFRRDGRVTRPESGLRVERAGLPVLRPEVVLLYMATSEDPKNEHDLQVVVPRLDAAALAWLIGALEVAYPGHRWLGDLDSR